MLLDMTFSCVSATSHTRIIYSRLGRVWLHPNVDAPVLRPSIYRESFLLQSLL